MACRIQENTPIDVNATHADNFLKLAQMDNAQDGQDKVGSDKKRTKLDSIVKQYKRKINGPIVKQHADTHW